MKVLVVSHNVFSKTSSMGKTLAGYFSGWDASEIAQFYIHSEIPTTSMCDSYYRVTDKEILKSIFSRTSGKIYSHNDFSIEREEPRTDSGWEAQVYQRARKRTPTIYLLRNLIWKIGKWNTTLLNNWLDKVQPDIVFFASGDYLFMYKIALYIAQNRNIPLVVSCMDDYYYFNKNKASTLGRLEHKLFMKQVKKAMSYAKCIVTICDKMKEDYARLFGKECYTLHTASTLAGPIHEEKTNQITYLGNLGYNRDKQLISIGKMLKHIANPSGPNYIDVYSTEIRTEILNGMTMENGICFHGAVGSDEVKKIMAQSLAVIHTEAFDAQTVDAVRYSVSTKIADSLASGTCILAYGPREVASIEYLSINNAAFVASNEEELKYAIEMLLTDSEKRNEIVNNAVALAKQNHQLFSCSETVKNILEHSIS